MCYKKNGEFKKSGSVESSIVCTMKILGWFNMYYVKIQGFNCFTEI